MSSYSCATHTLAVKIVADRTLEYTFSRYTEYAIAVFAGGTYVTSTWQRYKRFHQLHRELVRNTRAQRARLPSLPPKIRGRGAHPSVVADRRDELCQYINGLLNAVPDRLIPMLDRFLGLDRAPVPMPSSVSVSERNSPPGVPEYDHREIEQVQEIVGECDMLVEELADELGLAGMPGQDIARVKRTAIDLVEALRTLASQQPAQWQEALKAERERAAYLERSVRTLALQNERVLAGANPAAALPLPRALKSLDEGDQVADSSSDDDDDFFDTLSHHDTEFHDLPVDDLGTGADHATVTAANTARLARLNRIEGGGGGNGGGGGAADRRASLDGVNGGRRRTRIAAYKGFTEVSMWGFLKEVIGQDLTRITFPVAFNEPLSLLQRAAEDMEYSSLLDQAASCADSEQKLLYVAAFAISNYTATCHRLGKPFNPLLHETFEYIQPRDAERNCAGFRYVAEQVGHHPPVSAIHAEALPAATGETPAWTFWSDWEPKMSLSGARCNVVADGVSQCRFAETGDHFSWSKVTTQVNGIIVGTMAITHFGEMKIVNHKTGESCVIEFQQRGLWDFSPDQARLVGVLRSQSGVARYALKGSWDSVNGHLCAAKAAGDGGKVVMTPGKSPMPLTSTLLPHSARSRCIIRVRVLPLCTDEEPAELFRVAARPEDSARQYNFTEFAIGLNQQPGLAKRDGGAIGRPAPTDTTLRPDVRAMEEGNMTLAADEKHRLEVKQRAARKLRKEAGEHGESYVALAFPPAACYRSFLLRQYTSCFTLRMCIAGLRQASRRHAGSARNGTACWIEMHGYSQENIGLCVRQGFSRTAARPMAATISFDCNVPMNVEQIQRFLVG